MSTFEQSRLNLSDGQTYGIWSLIVTLFGDMAQGLDDRVSGKTLTTICENLGIKSQAMRVALHRLRKDGWIDSSKSGRQSAYFLTNMGRTESVKASTRIYAKRAPDYVGFFLAIAPNGSTSGPPPDDWISIGPETFISFLAKPKPLENALVSRHSKPIPEWLRDRLISADIVQSYQDFHSRIHSITTDHWPDLSVYETAALRVLLVHSWRRLILRHDELPVEAFPTHCPVGECHEMLSTLLGKLPVPSLNSLD